MRLAVYHEYSRLALASYGGQWIAATSMHTWQPNEHSHKEPRTQPSQPILCPNSHRPHVQSYSASHLHHGDTFTPVILLWCCDRGIRCRDTRSGLPEKTILGIHSSTQCVNNKRRIVREIADTRARHGPAARHHSIFTAHG